MHAGVVPDVYLYVQLLGALAEHGWNVEEAMSAYTSMQHGGLQPTAWIFIHLFQAHP